MSHSYSAIPSTTTTESLSGSTAGPSETTSFRSRLTTKSAAVIILLSTFAVSLLCYATQAPDFLVPDLAAPASRKQLKSKLTSAPLGCKVDVMIVRHCEGLNLRQYCTEYGEQRANHLSTLFGDGDERWPTPAALYARPPETGKMVLREIEMLQPLADKTGLPIRSKGYDIAHKREMVTDIFDDMKAGDLCGGLVVISWKHENIPKLARQLGCGVDQGCPERYPLTTYDDAWNIHYSYDQPVHTEHKSGKIDGPKWTIQGSVQRQNFDPVAWAKQGEWEGLE